MDPNPAPESFFHASDESLVARIAILSRELLRRNSKRLVHGEPVPVRHVNVPLPFSRAAATDYVRLVELWNHDRSTERPSVLPRPCPACRSKVSDHQFFSYDQYPYHACRRCGTWFVPLMIEDAVIDAFFARVPE